MNPNENDTPKNSDFDDELEPLIAEAREDPEFDRVYRETEADMDAAEAMYNAQMQRKIKRNPLRFLARKTGIGCWCCGQWRRRGIHWYWWRAPFGGPTWCTECKFDVCPLDECNADLHKEANINDVTDVTDVTD